ncbi:hypothetical protein [Streptomyces sp. NPDC053755]
MVDLLAANPREVVSVFLEDHVSADRLGRSLGAVRGLSPLLFP